MIIHYRVASIVLAATVFGCARAPNTRAGFPMSAAPLRGSYNFVGNVVGYGTFAGSVTFDDDTAKARASSSSCETSPSVADDYVLFRCGDTRITLDRRGDSLGAQGRVWIEKKYTLQVPNNNVALSCESNDATSRLAWSSLAPRDCLHLGQIAELHVRTYTGALRVSRVDSTTGRR